MSLLVVQVAQQFHSPFRVQVGAKFGVSSRLLLQPVLLFVYVAGAAQEDGESSSVMAEEAVAEHPGLRAIGTQ